MPQGGARVRSGPARDPNALSRERDKPGDWLFLSPEGRQGEAPGWPLGRPTQFELKMWVEEWKRPQAVIWEAHGQFTEVALYVRATAVANSKLATAADRNMVLRFMDDLGISQGGLMKNRWRIAGVGEQPQVSPADDADRRSAKERFRTIEGGQAS